MTTLFSTVTLPCGWTSTATLRSGTRNAPTMMADAILRRDPFQATVAGRPGVR